jgi:hypothetical protein
MPADDELPPGPVRAFVAELFDLYKDAHRPTLRKISTVIRDNPDVDGTASPETIRRMLSGRTVPTSWSTVNAVFVGLADIAGFEYDIRVSDPDAFESRGVQWRRLIERRWHAALDDAPVRPSETVDDPCAGDDDPPF